ncbi:MAG: prepilin-type N-terminal cleavage/methylation domain-containing protein [Acidobacteriales bacterium]|nr:prepilin-type N-terminal cleavage/methylation domain-containing protein [Terriglobales bacterium]
MMMLKSQTKRLAAVGFSLVELLVVVTIVLIVSAVAIPNVLQGMRFLRLRSNATNIATLLQQARMRSVRDNRSYQLLFAPNAPGMNNNPILFVDGTVGPLSFNGTYDQGEPLTVLATDVQISNAAPAGAPDIFIQTAMAPDGAGGAQPMALQVAASLATAPTFNPRGIPCQINGGGTSSPTAVCNTTGGGNQPIGYVVYLQSTTIANDGWSAITVSPGGRIRTWIYAPTTVNRWR